MLRNGYIPSHRLFQLMVESGWKIDIDRVSDERIMVRLFSRSEILMSTTYAVGPKDISASMMMVIEISNV